MKDNMIQRDFIITEKEDSWEITLAWGEDGAKAGMSYSKSWFKTREDVEKNMSRIIEDYEGFHSNKWS